MINLVKALIPEARIYLFGSRAKGSYGERSDIDVALDAKKKLNISELSEIKEVLNASNISYPSTSSGRTRVKFISLNYKIL